MPEFFFTIATAGHVDHGKTSVIKKLTGIDTDRLKEEKERQMTTDLGFAHKDLAAPPGFDSDTVFRVGFIDVPGHGKFLKNMLAGVGCLDLALLVVAADEGVMPQTIQHAEIISLLGIKSALVVITKVDMAMAETLAESRASIQRLLDDLGMKTLSLTEVSCHSGSGFDKLESNLSKALARLASDRLSTQSKQAAYLPVDRVFNKTGYGLVVTGTLARGQICPGDNVVIYPSAAKARVRGLETFGRKILQASAGQRLAVNLAVRDSAVKIERGTIVSSTELKASKSILVALRFPYPRDQKVDPITGLLRVYHGSAEYQASWSWWQSDEDDKTIFAQLKIKEDFFGRPGELIIIRQPDESIIGGTILATARYRWLNRKNALNFLNLLNGRRFDRAIELVIESSPNKLLSVESCLEFLPEEVLDNTLKETLAMRLGDTLTTRGNWISLKEAILHQAKALIATQIERREEPEIKIENLRTGKFPRLNHTLFNQLIDELHTSQAISKQADKLSIESLKQAGHTQIDESLLAAIESELSKYLCIEITQLLVEVKDSKQSRRALAELEKRGQLRIVAHDFAASTKAIATAHQALSQVWHEKKQISPSDFKEALGTTRKYAMALLSYFDDELITRRTAEKRVLLREPKK
jgi:selenocysteine-specific elongation factor